MKQAFVSFQISLPICISKDGSWFVASCPALDVYSQGKTPDEAKANLTEALQLFVASCFERGTLDEVLKESGFRPSHEEHIGKDQVEDNLNISLPLLAANYKNNAKTHAC